MSFKLLIIEQILNRLPQIKEIVYQGKLLTLTEYKFAK